MRNDVVVASTSSPDAPVSAGPPTPLVRLAPLGEEWWWVPFRRPEPCLCSTSQRGGDEVAPVDEAAGRPCVYREIGDTGALG
jgi:hypothetical protein